MGEQMAAQDEFGDCNATFFLDQIPFATYSLKSKPTPPHAPFPDCKRSTLQARDASAPTLNGDVTSHITTDNTKMLDTGINVLRNILTASMLIIYDLAGGHDCDVVSEDTSIPGTNTKILGTSYRLDGFIYCNKPGLEALVDVSDWLIANSVPDAKRWDNFQVTCTRCQCQGNAEQSYQLRESGMTADG